MSGKTLKDKVDDCVAILRGYPVDVPFDPENHRNGEIGYMDNTFHDCKEALVALEEKVKELEGKDRYEFPVDEWNEQLVQTINDTGCPAKIVLTRRNPRQTTEGINEE